MCGVLRYRKVSGFASFRGTRERFAELLSEFSAFYLQWRAWGAARRHQRSLKHSNLKHIIPVDLFLLGFGAWWFSAWDREVREPALANVVDQGFCGFQMLTDSVEQAETFLKALSSRHRLMVLSELHQGERSAGALIDAVGLS